MPGLPYFTLASCIALSGVLFQALGKEELENPKKGVKREQ
jgi:hypothetical protein